MRNTDGPDRLFLVFEKQGTKVLDRPRPNRFGLFNYDEPFAGWLSTFSSLLGSCGATLLANVDNQRGYYKGQTRLTTRGGSLASVPVLRKIYSRLVFMPGERVRDSYEKNGEVAHKAMSSIRVAKIKKCSS